MNTDPLKLRAKERGTQARKTQDEPKSTARNHLAKYARCRRVGCATSTDTATWRRDGD
jgi:hypothetical protein